MDLDDNESELNTSQSVEANDNSMHSLQNEYITKVFEGLNLNDSVTGKDRHCNIVAEQIRRMNAVRRRLFDSCSSSDESASIVTKENLPVIRKRAQKLSTLKSPRWKKQRLQINEARRKQKQRELRQSNNVDTGSSSLAELEVNNPTIAFCQKEVKNNRKIIHKTEQESSDSE